MNRILRYRVERGTTEVTYEQETEIQSSEGANEVTYEQDTEIQSREGGDRGTV